MRYQLFGSFEAFGEEIDQKSDSRWQLVPGGVHDPGCGIQYFVVFKHRFKQALLKLFGHVVVGHANKPKATFGGCDQRTTMRCAF